jgi:hypothetical protein
MSHGQMSFEDNLHNIIDVLLFIDEALVDSLLRRLHFVA